MSAESQKLLCQCGALINPKNKGQHEKSQKHQLGMTTHQIASMESPNDIMSKSLKSSLSKSTDIISSLENKIDTKLDYIIEVTERLMELVEGLYNDDEEEEVNEQKTN